MTSHHNTYTPSAPVVIYDLEVDLEDAMTKVEEIKPWRVNSSTKSKSQETTDYTNLETLSDITMCLHRTKNIPTDTYANDTFVEF